MAGITGLESFRKHIDTLKKNVQGQITLRYRAYVKSMLYDLAVNTPQWSGDTAASWQVVAGKGSQAESVKSGLKVTPWRSLRGNEKQMGDMEAVNLAMQRNEGNIAAIKWNSHVSIVNNNPAMRLMVEGKVLLRDVNRGGASGFRERPDFTMVAVLSYVHDKYSYKGTNLSTI